MFSFWENRFFIVISHVYGYLKMFLKNTSCHEIMLFKKNTTQVFHRCLRNWFSILLGRCLDLKAATMRRRWLPGPAPVEAREVTWQEQAGGVSWEDRLSTFRGFLHLKPWELNPKRGLFGYKRLPYFGGQPKKRNEPARTNQQARPFENEWFELLLGNTLENSKFWNPKMEVCMRWFSFSNGWSSPHIRLTICSNLTVQSPSQTNWICLEWFCWNLFLNHGWLFFN